MKLKLLNRDYSYAYTSFELNGDIYTFIGTKCEEWENIKLCEDSFRNQKGKFFKMVREVLMERQKEGNIKPIPESEVKLNTGQEKTKRRAV